jgi:hypothetical protein
MLLFLMDVPGVKRRIKSREVLGNAHARQRLARGLDLAQVRRSFRGLVTAATRCLCAH